ncbi:LPS translocon maturation chaperone LptM [Variovorax paradoxus]|uniref:LPS translocon maturation chaperone LptM n=1 Tax=Variovorax paradoxus TaxID=34073 RepID=UPI0027811C27|nr:putative small lipoprotein YifL [Variovorax paradoxus]
MSASSRAALMVCLAAAAGGLAACGQRGPLSLPTDPAAANRATLPQLLTPGGPRASDAEAAPQPAAASSAPAPAGSNTGTGVQK